MALNVRDLYRCRLRANFGTTLDIQGVNVTTRSVAEASDSYLPMLVVEARRSVEAKQNVRP